MFYYLCNVKDKNARMKKIITLCLAMMLAINIPMVTLANTAIEIIEPDLQPISVSANNSRLHVVGANGLMLKVYNVAGVCIWDIRIEGNDKYYDLNLSKGCYIVKVGKVVRKISVK